jgi:hypothetical protein
MPTLAEGYEWQLDTGTANTVTLNIVPEPSALVLTAASVALLLARRRRA